VFIGHLTFGLKPGCILSTAFDIFDTETEFSFRQVAPIRISRSSQSYVHVSDNALRTERRAGSCQKMPVGLGVLKMWTVKRSGRVFGSRATVHVR